MDAFTYVSYDRSTSGKRKQESCRRGKAVVAVGCAKLDVVSVVWQRRAGLAPGLTRPITSFRASNWVAHANERVVAAVTRAKMQAGKNNEQQPAKKPRLSKTRGNNIHNNDAKSLTSSAARRGAGPRVRDRHLPRLQATSPPAS